MATATTPNARTAATAEAKITDVFLFIFRR
jgi:hypothetical protein